MRVISGSLKGRSIKGEKIIGTRPTMDKIKESVFAMIQDDIEEAVGLDLFAGSGSLGIEAISNGAKMIYFIDNNKIAIKTIFDNVTTFNIEKQATIILNDYMKSLLYFKNNYCKFNIIFLDPPYKENLITNVLHFIDDNNLLMPKGKIICEYTKEDLDDNYHNLTIFKDKKNGDKKIRIYVNSK